MNAATPAFANEWLIVEPHRDHTASGHWGSLHALANGLLGVRGGAAELHSGHGTILARSWVSNPLTYHERFPGYANATDTRPLGPGITGIRIALDGATVDFETAEAVEARGALCLKTATLDHRTHWRLADGRELVIATERFVPLGEAALCAQRIMVRPLNFSATITVECLVAMASEPGGNAADPRISARTSFVARSVATDDQALVARFEAGAEGNTPLAVFQHLAGDSHAEVSQAVSAGETLTIDRFVALSDEGDETGARAALEEAVASGFDDLHDRHRQALARFWCDTAISMSADPALEQALRFNLLQLFLSASRTSEVGTAAKGLSGEGYEGHAFWDSEVFVLPVLALTRPELARNGIAYRIARLDRARAHARAIGHPRGALFPWRTIGGDECSAHYPTGSAQYHVNAAVAYALEIYLAASSDTSILAEGGAELLVETARLWFDVGHFSERRGGAFLIHGVTGPDEYTALVDNDFYTNAMARRHLLFAARAIGELATSDPETFYTLALATGLEDGETADWQRAAEHMWLPLDARLGVHPQDDSFLDKPLYPVTPGEGNGHTPLLMRVHPMVLYRHRLTKQGDVVQAHVTAGLDASLAQIRRDVDYYEPLTTHDSTLSMTAFAICAAWLGDDARAFDYWHQTALVDLGNLHGNTGHGLHMAAMAGSWLVLAQGYARMRFDDKTLRLAPRCPEGWSGYAFRLRWRGSLVDIAVTLGETRYTLIDGPALELFDHGRRVVLASRPISVARPAIAAVIFDLDGVLTDTAEAHYQAWKRLADEHGIPFDREVNEGLKGIDRSNSLRRILAAAGVEVDEATFATMLVHKNGYYVDSIADFSPADVFPGAESLLRDCRQAGLRIGLASASRNAAALVERLGIARWFDHVTDSATISRGKPDPGIFLETARALGIAPENCLGIEDASAGIAAIRDAGMASFGVGSAQLLSDADRVFPAIGSITLPDVLAAGK